MKLIRYIESWFEVGTHGASEAKFEAGKHYPITDETQAHAARGIAEEVEVPDDVQKAEAAAETAEAKAEKAAAAAEDARIAAAGAAAGAELAQADKA